MFSGTIGTILLVLSIASFGLLPVRFIGILFLIASVVCFVIELKAPGLGIWGALGLLFLLLGGWFLYDRSGGVSVSPWALVGVAAFAGVFFGIVVAAALKMRHQPSIWSRSVIGQEGVALPAGVGPKGGDRSGRVRRVAGGRSLGADRRRREGTCHLARRARAHRRAVQRRAWRPA